MRARDARLNNVENPVLQYVEYMTDATLHTCEWGTAREVYVLAHLKQVNIVV